MVPARARHPKDKALEENAVKLMYRTVYVDLEGIVFHDLESLNEAILKSIVSFNARNLTRRKESRRQLFEAVEKEYLRPLPADRYQMERLASLDFVRKGDNLFITGCSGTGKSYLATALGYEACKAGIRVLYANASKLMGTLKIAKNKGTIEAELKKIEKRSSSSSMTSSLYHSMPGNERT